MLMKNNIKFLLVALLIAAAGGGAYLLTKDDSNTESSQNETSQQTANVNQNNLANENLLGLDIASLDQPYRLTVKTTEGTDETAAIMEYDGKGNTAMTITAPEGTTRIVNVDGASYMQNPGDGSWIKFPSGDPSVDTSQYDAGLSAQDIEEINSDASIVDKGKGSCSAGECRIYESTDNTTQDRVVIKVHDKTNRISDMEITSTDGNITLITYDYTTPVNIVAPEGAVEFNLDDFGSIPE